MDWLNNLFEPNKNLPVFWQNYVSCFKHINQDRLVVLDCETTGLDTNEDRILSIGAVALHQNVIVVEDCFSVFIKQNKKNAKSVAIHGIVENENQSLYSEAEAIEKLLQFLGNALIVGHHIAFDLEMINLSLKRLGLPKLKNKSKDTSYLYAQFKGVQIGMQVSLDDLCMEFNIPKKERHTALGDAFLTAQVYQRLVIQ